MSLLRPSDPVPPPDPAGRADLRASSITGAVSGTILWALQRYVWHGEVPEQVALLVWTTVPAGLAYLSGRAVRHRRHCRANPSPVPPAPTDPPA